MQLQLFPGVFKINSKTSLDKYNMHNLYGVVWQMQSGRQITEAIKNVNFQVAELKLKSSLFEFFASWFASPLRLAVSNFAFNETLQTRSEQFRTVSERIGYLLSVGGEIRCRLFIVLPTSFLIYKWFRNFHFVQAILYVSIYTAHLGILFRISLIKKVYVGIQYKN